MTSEKRTNSILMTRHYRDMGSFSDWSCRVGNLIQPIRSTTRIWVVTRHQYGISALVSHTSFGGKPVVASPNVCCFLGYLISRSLKVLSESQKIDFSTKRLQMAFVELHDWWFDVQVKNERTTDIVYGNYPQAFTKNNLALFKTITGEVI